jgi:U3 small nucleolar RNA-associated protein 21
MSCSPKGDFLATTHADSLGIYIWASKAYFTNVYLKSISNDPVSIAFPDGLELSSFDYEPESDEHAQSNRKFDLVAFSPGESDLLKLSGIPRSNLQTLTHLDILKERNKAQTTIKPEKEIPFFLDSLISADPNKSVVVNDLNTSLGDTKKEVKAKRSHSMRSLTDFISQSDVDALGVLEYLRGLTPSEVEYGISTLEGDSLGALLDVLATAMSSGRDFDAVVAYLSVMLRVHGSDMLHHGVKLQQLADIATQRTHSLEDRVDHTMSLLSYLLGGTQ